MAEGDEESDDKPYEPSQKKLQDARKKGDIPRSTDLNTTAAYLGIVLASFIWGGGVVQAIGDNLIAFMSPDMWRAIALKESTTSALLSGHLASTALAVLPLFALPIVLVLLSLAGQRAFVAYGGNLEPKLSKLSILKNAKKKFGRKGLFEFFKSFLKLCLFTGTLIYFVSGRQHDIVQSAMIDTRQVILLMGELGLSFFLIALFLAGAIGVVDYLFQRAEHMRKMRMSHKEMMDELKNSEGDPAMKQRRRQRGMEIAKSQMLADVKNADVIIVNPEHYAVALKWSRAPGTAPELVAKGVDELAASIRRLANENGVPIYREPPTARAIYAAVEVGEEIAPEHYQAVAAAIRFAEEMRIKQRQRTYASD